ncbi:MAG: hypothetical protein WKF84_08610 [Pyrinomonadaceae bacterium]
MRESGDLAEAVSEFTIALQLKPEMVEAHNELGLTLLQYKNRRKLSKNLITS